eukprot:m.23179 g.23179  ORF g.23179 m.23179 type:complete len:109 (-) comp11346_c0_seq2:14-340(-)
MPCLPDSACSTCHHFDLELVTTVNTSPLLNERVSGLSSLKSYRATTTSPELIAISTLGRILQDRRQAVSRVKATAKAQWVLENCSYSYQAADCHKLSAFGAPSTLGLS